MSKLVIINIFNLEIGVYFTSNFTNLNNKFCQYQESDINR
jgi:hypothetical protein